VGLGAAANVLTVLRGTRSTACPIRVVSFDRTIEPLRFALEHSNELGYFEGYEERLRELSETNRVRFADGVQKVLWTLHIGDFPHVIKEPAAQLLPKPHTIMFDAFSPATN